MDTTTAQASIRIPQLSLEQLAGEFYETYCAGVGGVAFNGDALPNWVTFRADPAKKKQSEAWIAVAERAMTLA